MSAFPEPFSQYAMRAISTESMQSVGPHNRGLLSSAISSGTLTANQAVFVPVLLHEPMTVAQLWCYNHTTVTSNVDMGLYDSGGNRLVSIGSTAQAGTSAIQVFNVTDTLVNPGLYYMALACQSASSTIKGFVHSQNGIAAALGLVQQASAFPLPATATFAAYNKTLVPAIGFTALANL